MQGSDEYQEFHVSCAQLTIPGAFLVAVAGDVDMHTAPALDGQLSQLIDRGARHVVVDLCATGFIDSTGLGVLIRALKRLQSDGNDLVLVSDDVRFLRTLEITGLSRRFHVERSLAAAVDRAAAVAA